MGVGIANPGHAYDLTRSNGDVLSVSGGASAVPSTGSPRSYEAIREGHRSTGSMRSAGG